MSLGASTRDVRFQREIDLPAAEPVVTGPSLIHGSEDVTDQPQAGEVARINRERRSPKNPACVLEASNEASQSSAA